MGFGTGHFPLDAFVFIFLGWGGGSCPQGVEMEGGAVRREWRWRVGAVRMEWRWRGGLSGRSGRGWGGGGGGCVCCSTSCVIKKLGQYIAKHCFNARPGLQ